jgi:hypothetical protein
MSAIEVKWNVINKEGKAKIWLATTNHLKTGSHDDYKLVAEFSGEWKSKNRCKTIAI